MATQASRSAARFMISPSVILLFVWMAVPLAMVIYYSFRRYRLLNPERAGFAGTAGADADDPEALLLEDAREPTEVGDVEPLRRNEDEGRAVALVDERDGTSLGVEHLALNLCHGEILSC